MNQLQDKPGEFEAITYEEIVSRVLLADGEQVLIELPCQDFERRKKGVTNFKAKANLRAARLGLPKDTSQFEYLQLEGSTPEMCILAIRVKEEPGFQGRWLSPSLVEEEKDAEGAEGAGK